MPRQYYFAKLGKGNVDLEAYLPSSLRIGQDGQVPIYFEGSKTSKQALLNELSSRPKRNGFGDVKAFFDCAENSNNSAIVVMHNQKRRFMILEPAGKVKFRAKDRKEHGKKFVVKILPARIVWVGKFSDVPPILLGLGSNQYLTRGTFRPINAEKYPGVIYALEGLINKKTSGNLRKICSLDLLDSIQLETLIAKIFEAHGFFVPARTGGNMPEVDLLPKNITKRKAQIFGKTISSNEVIPVQIKLSSESVEDRSDILNICINKNPKHTGAWLDKNDIEKSIDGINPKIKGIYHPRIWLKELTSWARMKS